MGGKHSPPACMCVTWGEGGVGAQFTILTAWIGPLSFWSSLCLVSRRESPPHPHPWPRASASRALLPSLCRPSPPRGSGATAQASVSFAARRPAPVLPLRRSRPSQSHPLSPSAAVLLFLRFRFPRLECTQPLLRLARVVCCLV